MIQFEFRTRRGNLNLNMACRLESPWTVVFGESGAGKSTLLRLIAGLDLPDYGRLSVNGQYLMDTEIGMRQRRLGEIVGMVTQQHALFPHLSVAANVGFGIGNYGSDLRRSRVSAMLELVGAAHLVDRPVRALSGGEAQRVSLARALAPMPSALLLDEPLSALDGRSRDGLLANLQEWLFEARVQTVVVTHDVTDALATEAEVVLLHEGKLAGIGPANRVLAAERNRLLARLDAISLR